MITADQARELIESSLRGLGRQYLLDHYLPAIEAQWECWHNLPEVGAYCERDLALLEKSLREEISIIQQFDSAVPGDTEAKRLSELDQLPEHLRWQMRHGLISAFEALEAAKKLRNPEEPLPHGMLDWLRADLEPLRAKWRAEKCTRCNGTGEVPGWLGVGIHVPCGECKRGE